MGFQFKWINPYHADNICTEIAVSLLLCLFDLILYVPVNNFFSYVGMGLPGLKPVLSKDL